MVQVVGDAGERFELTQTHKEHRLRHPRPGARAALPAHPGSVAPAPEPVAPLLIIAAKAVHIALYGLLLGDAFVRLADGVDHAGARPDVGIRVVRHALSLAGRLRH